MYVDNDLVYYINLDFFKDNLKRRIFNVVNFNILYKYLF